MPVPEVATPLAKERRVVNHWGITPTEPVNSKPIPQPKHMPCERNRCQVSFAKEAPIKARVSKNTPIKSVTRVPNLRVEIVAMGEIS